MPLSIEFMSTLYKTSMLFLTNIYQSDFYLISLKLANYSAHALDTLPSYLPSQALSTHQTQQQHSRLRNGTII